MSMSLYMPSRNPPFRQHAPSRDRHNTPPSSKRRWPRLDDHVVQPETREALVRGQRILEAGAKPPHADTQAGIAAIMTARMRPGFTISTELLSRLNEESDFATDVCVRKDGIDPTTDERHLEELAFEVVSEQRTGYMTTRAEDLAARGVRRIIGIFLKKRAVGEWVAETHAWRWLPADGLLDDPCLASPVPVRALLEAASAVHVKDAVAHGIVETKHPVIEQAMAQGRRDAIQQGIQQGLAPLVRMIERRVARPLTEAERMALFDRLSEQGAEYVGDAVLDMSPGQLAAWLTAAGGH